MEWINVTIEGLALIVPGIITGVVAPWIRSKVGEAKLSQIVTWAKYMVESAEVLFPEAKSGDNKREYVLKGMAEIINKIGYDITADRLRDILESAVKKLNKENENEQHS